MASMKGGHFFTVICSSFSSALKAMCGIALNQFGSPSRACVGRGKSPASSGGQRNLIVLFTTSSPIGDPHGLCELWPLVLASSPTAIHGAANQIRVELVISVQCDVFTPAARPARRQ